MQQRNAPVLSNALAVGNVNHLLGRYALGALCKVQRPQTAGVLLEQVIGLHPAPRVALDALDNAIAEIVVADWQVIRLQQLQGKGYACQMLIAGHAALQHLRQGLAVTQPGAAHQALDLRPGQLAGCLGLERPFRPCRLDRRSKRGVHRTVIPQRNWLHSDTRAAHHTLIKTIKYAGDKVMVFFQGADLLAHGLQRRLQGRVSAARLAYRPMGP
ncbi:hypothetical protein BC89_30550 [Pseudomonas monteilii]|nr:hypothetical protein BC89_30550 [Pseudomonas monteilii]